MAIINEDSWAEILAALADEEGQPVRDIYEAQYTSLVDYQKDSGQREQESASHGERVSVSSSNARISTAMETALPQPSRITSLHNRHLMSRDKTMQSAGQARLRSADKQLCEIQPSGFCFACSNIKIGNRYPSTHHTASNLTQSAIRGCPFCYFIGQNCNGIRSRRSAEVTVDTKNSILRYRVPEASDLVFELFTHKENRALQTSAINFRFVPPDSMSEEALTLVRAWLGDCYSTKHRSCTRDFDFHLPTRVIDVSGQEPCLRELNLTKIPYIALSHCWGDKPTLTTSKSTLSHRMKGIPYSTLPQTFQDAVTVAKALGISYLWIDSLCIVQDSMEDWVAECPKMRAYYRNAYVTVSALESPTSDHGFLSPRLIGDEALLPNETGIWVRPKLLERRKIFQKAHLNHRGWALQERLLSTCVLHFTQQEMFWECQTCSAQESSTEVNDQLTNFQSLVSSEGDDFKRSLTCVGEDRFSYHDGAFALWMRLIHQFSRRSLTYPTDKLPAISGLAEIMAPRTKSKYMAGLWEDDLHGLAWFIDGPDEVIFHVKNTNRDAGYLAPSWSWVKMDRSITYRFNEEERVTSHKDPILISADIRTRDSNPFSGISEGSLTLQALTKQVQCVYTVIERFRGDLIHGYISPKYWAHHSFHALPLEVFAEDGTAVGTGCFDFDFNKSMLHLCKAVRIAERWYKREPYWADDEEEEGHGETKSWVKGSENVDQGVIYFLLVQPDEKNEGAWKRVGAGMTRNFDHRKHYPDFFDLWDWEELRLF